MARCKCNNPCTCYFEFDGDRPNTLYSQPWQNGRYSTRKKGSGTSADPFVIEFLDSEEFQVEAGQAVSPLDQTIASSGSGSDGFFAKSLTQVDYETPNEIFIAFDVHKVGPTSHEFFLSSHKFWFVSAEATFVYNGNATGMRRIFVYYEGPAGDFGVDGSTVIAGSTTTAIGEDTTLSCSGLAPYMTVSTNPYDNGPDGKYIIGIMQSSGANMIVRNIRFTAVAI